MVASCSMIKDLDMPEQDGYRTVTIDYWQCNSTETRTDEVADECAIAMVYNGISHAVMMATPCDLTDFALGFSLSEGIITKPSELYSCDILQYDTGFELQLTISSARMMQLKQQRRSLAGRTGCGLCGTESLQQAIRPIASVPKQALPKATAIQYAQAHLTHHQPLKSLTGALHAAAWCDETGQIQCVREDVGRHNALDKLLGALCDQNIDRQQGFVLISSRASYEMVQKVCSLGISNLVAVSAPTALAIQQAKQAGLNLIGFARQNHFVIYHQQ